MIIRKFKVTNFRSLKNVNLVDLSDVVVFFGDNDTGKSNLLAFLEIIFQEKYNIDTTTLSSEREESKIPSGFWDGIVDNFSDNFFRNEDEPISFAFLISFQEEEISFIPRIIIEAKHKNRSTHDLKFSGEIQKVESIDRARFVMHEVSLNQVLIFDRSKPDASKYFPDIIGVSESEAVDIFGRLMGLLNNTFLRIPPNRFLRTEDESERGIEISLTADTFKNWLFTLSLNKDTESIYHEILKGFNERPFELGKISIARIGVNKLEIYVQDEFGHKVPVGRKGTGIQQILVILAYITQSKAAIIGIEELEVNLSPQTQKSIFHTLKQLINTSSSNVSQVFLPTHSTIIASRPHVEKRQVTIANGETVVEKPTDENYTDFFNPI